jgi:hypothetical protein
MLKETIGRLPSMFVEEFGLEMYKYNTVIDHYDNQFEVVAEKWDDNLSFAHGSNEIHNCYVDVQDNRE